MGQQQPALAARRWQSAGNDVEAQSMPACPSPPQPLPDLLQRQQLSSRCVDTRDNNARSAACISNVAVVASGKACGGGGGNNRWGRGGDCNNIAYGTAYDLFCAKKRSHPSDLQISRKT